MIIRNCLSLLDHLSQLESLMTQIDIAHEQKDIQQLVSLLKKFQELTRPT
jgi:hypothetical protein